MVDVEAPGLAVEGFGDSVLDAGETDFVGAGGAGRHLLEGGVGEAALAFVEGVGLFGFLLVEEGGELGVDGFLSLVPLFEEWVQDCGAELQIQLFVSGPS